MPRCEDYPCCGHGPAPMGDGGGCPDEDGRFNCVLCTRKLEKGARSSICVPCQRMPSSEHEMAGHYADEEDY